MKALKIIKCSDPSYWYANLVGQIVPLVALPSYGEYLSREPAGFTNIVKQQDAEVTEL